MSTFGIFVQKVSLSSTTVCDDAARWGINGNRRSGRRSPFPCLKLGVVGNPKPAACWCLFGTERRVFCSSSHSWWWYEEAWAGRNDRRLRDRRTQRAVRCFSKRKPSRLFLCSCCGSSEDSCFLWVTSVKEEVGWTWMENRLQLQLGDETWHS